MSEQPNPYGGIPAAGDGAAAATAGLPRRVRVHHLREFKQRGERFAMLTAYDQYAAAIFEQAGIPVLLVGDSRGQQRARLRDDRPGHGRRDDPAGPRGVPDARGAALVVADLPFGSYQSGPEQALATSMRMMKEGLAHAVKLEGGARVAPSVEHDRRRRHPGDGPHRLHPAERARARRVPGPGPGRRGRRPARRRRAGPAGGRRVRRRAGDGPGTRRRARSPRRSTSRRSGSAPARTATPRCWSGRT